MATAQELQHQITLREVQLASEAQGLTGAFVGDLAPEQRLGLITVLMQGNQYTDPIAGETRGNQFFIEQEATAFVDRFELIKVQTNDNYGYSATAWQERATGDVYVGVRSTENRVEVLNGNPTGGDFTRDSLADKQILQTGFAWGQTASHVQFLEELSGLTNSRPVYQSAYSLSGNLVSNALLAGVNLGTTGGHLAVNAAGAGSVGVGTMFDAINTYERLRNPIALTNAELDTIYQRLPEGAIRRITFDQLYNDALNAEFDGIGQAYWQQSLGADYGATYNDAREQLAVMATQVLYQTSYNLLGSQDARLGGVAYLYGHAQTGVDTQIVANGGLTGSTQEVWIPGQPLFIADNGLFSAVGDVLSGQASANSDFATTHSAILVDQTLKLQSAFQSLNPGLTSQDFNLILQSSGNTRASLIAPNGDAAFSEYDTLSLAVNNLGNLLGLPALLDSGVVDVWNGNYRADFSAAVSQINARIIQLQAADPTIQLIALVPQLQLQPDGFGVTEIDFYSDVRALAGQDSAEGNAVRQALDMGSPFALVGGSLNTATYNLGNFSEAQLNNLAGNYVDKMQDSQGNLTGGVAQTRWTSATAGGGSIEVVQTDANDAVSLEYDPDQNLVEHIELDGDSNTLIQTDIQNATGTSSDIYDIYTGALLGQTQTLIAPDIYSLIYTGDPLADLLDSIRSSVSFEDQSLITASEIRALTGTQGAGETFGGTRLLEFSGDALSDYWNFTNSSSFTGTWNYFDGAVDYNLLPGDTTFSFGDSSPLLSMDYSGLGFLPSFGLGGDTDALLSYDYSSLGNTTTTSFSTPSWEYSSDWYVVDGLSQSTFYSTIDAPSIDYFSLPDFNSWSSGSDDLFFYSSDSYYDTYFWPVALDLDGDGVELVSEQDSRAYYDVKGDGFRSNVGWIGADDAFLAIDKDGNGKIEQSDELSFALWTAAPNDTDLEALKTVFDTNQDNTLDASDAQFSQLRVWQDANGDGVTDAGELKTLSERGIAAINLTAAQTDWASGGNHITGFTTFQKTDGSNGWAADVGLGYEADGWKATVESNLVRVTQSGGLVYGLTQGGALNLDLGAKGLNGAFGGAGADTLTAGSVPGALLNGGDGNDTLTGGAGDDWISGGLGSDVLNGGAGDDTLLIDAADLQANINGGAGFDIAVVMGTAGVTLDLFHTKLEAAIGGDGNDRFNTTGTGRTVLAGQGGDDILKSGAGHDVLQGGTGNDTLYGGLGTDTAIYTGNQADYEFVANANGSLTVRDINVANGDDGSDTLYGIQTIRFADGDISLSPANTGKGEFRVNTTTVRDQFYPTVAALADGGYVVAWMDDTATGTDANIYAQRYGADGNVAGAEFRVNTYTTSQQEIPSVAGLTDGGYVVVWRSYGQDGSLRGIYAQRYAVGGSSVGGEFRVNTYTSNHQDDPTVIATADGGFLVTWQSNLQDGSGYGVFAQRYAASGSAYGAEFRVNTTTTSHQNNPEVTLLTDGGYVVTWSSGATPSTSNIYAQRYAADGNKVGGQVKVNTTVYGAESSVTALADGGYVVAWLAITGGSRWDVFAQRYIAGGTAVGGELMLSTLPTGSSSTTYNSLQVAPVVTALIDGSYVVTWTAYTATGADLYLRRAVDGNAIGDVIRVNTTTADNQSTPAVTAMPDGGFVVTLTSVGAGVNEDTFAQRYDADGRPWTSDLTLAGSVEADHLNSTSSAAAVTLLGLAGDDTYVIGAGDTVVENANEGIDSVQSSVAYTLGANVENLILTGVAAINGTGNALNNTLTGNSAANVLAGGAGDDTYVVGAGDTVVENANEGIDSVQSSVTYTLGANVENLTLTGNVAIDGTGNELANVLRGNSAANILTGGAGDDTYVFGKGSGQDAINSYDTTVGKVDAVLFDATVAPLEVLVSRLGNDLVLSINGTTDTLTIQHYLDNDGASAYTVEQIKFFGGAIWDVATVKSLINKAPVLTTALPDQAVSQGEAFNYVVPAGAFTDPDAGDTLNYSVTLADGSALPSWLSFDAATRTFSGTPSTLGTVSVRVTATDSGNLMASDIFDLTVNTQNLTLNGTPDADTLSGGTGNDTINGLAGNDTLNGNAGNDTLSGGTGDDTFIVDSTGDVVVESLNEGWDLVESSVTYALASNVDRLTLTGAAAINGTGNELDNEMVGNDGANILDGDTGNDALSGGLGNDTLNGGAGYDHLDGGAGADRLEGGADTDVYVVDNTGDVVVESLNEGWDLVESSVTYALASNVERLTLTGAAAINGTGNELANVLRGNSASNTLSGLDGDDTIYAGGGDEAYGGEGNDTLILENTNSWTALFGEGGNDVLIGGSSLGLLVGGTGSDTITGGLGMNFIWGDDQIANGLGGNDIITGGNGYDYVVAGEGDDVVYGSGGGDYLVGNQGNDTLMGGPGDDFLDGGTGADAMTGGVGNDTYVVDDRGDVVTETTNLASEIDTVQSSVTYSLAANVENLTLTGTATINGTGNELANVLRGNSASNTLSGLDGDDTIYAGGGDEAYGGEGNDTLILENTNSWTALFGEGGNDVLIGGSSLGLLVGGTGSDTITGSLGINFIWGDDQIANGLGGNDIITGGNDYDYVVAGEGDDVVYGNGGGDYLVGNQGNDTLYGGAGNDTLMDGPGDDFLDGGLGADSLNGGAGDDTYILGRGYGIDTVVENDTSAGNTDIAQFLTGVSADQIWFKQATNNLEVSIIGSSDKLVINDWYLGDANHVEQFKTTDGARTLLDSDVQNLVNAMASFAPLAAGQATLPTNYQDALAGVIAANWQ